MLIVCNRIFQSLHCTQNRFSPESAYTKMEEEKNVYFNVCGTFETPSYRAR